MARSVAARFGSGQSRNTCAPFAPAAPAMAAQACPAARASSNLTCIAHLPSTGGTDVEFFSRELSSFRDASGATITPDAPVTRHFALAGNQTTGAQFIDESSTAGGARYLVGDLRQRTASVTARASLAFTPTLTVQAYAQPFVSNGRFPRAGEVVNPLARRAGDRVRFFSERDVETSTDGEQVTYRTSGGSATVDNPDFSITNLNANVVLRWEYRAGSTSPRCGVRGDEDAHDGAPARGLNASCGRLRREVFRSSGRLSRTLAAHPWSAPWAPARRPAVGAVCAGRETVGFAGR